MEQLEIQTGCHISAPPVAPALNHDISCARRWSECTRLAGLALSNLDDRNLPVVQEILIALLGLASQTFDATHSPQAISARLGFAVLPPSSPFRDARHWQPPSRTPALSQWPLVIRALGNFELTINGIPFERARKAPRKPLELLKALIACGDATAGAAELADDLWPDAEGDAAQDSLRVALYRLRRLLTLPHAVIVQNATLRLNPYLCWVDAWMFEQAAEDAARACLDDDRLTERLERALQMYRGHLFVHETERSWMLTPRERLRQHWLDAVYRVGTRYQIRRRWARACRLYEHATECDPATEELYRRLMVCHYNIGNRAEALHTYRRCRSQLARLGVLPSPETERLFGR